MSSVELFDPIAEKRPSKSVFPLRHNEPEYAKLNDKTTNDTNRYGQPIELIPLQEAESLNINGVDAIGFNPNRNKQHAFHFTADNCIGCHACESACSEKNDLPAHLSFRSVGYVEGGTFPNFTRMNISMACNHCDDPVCLKGCPTRAYTKHPEYGAVIQDPDICFGCGYCTWVCPYNAPQLDPVKGQVEKCNMCVDRLEVGLKPACVSACLGNALNFGVVENTPENRDKIDTSIPGFPDPEITHPNIRFQQTRSLPREMTRTDTMPIKYRKDDTGRQYRPSVDKKTGTDRQWNLAGLSSRENPLVAFTLSVQAAMGLFAGGLLLRGMEIGAASLAVPSWALTLQVSTVVALLGLGLLLSTVHLGKPMRFYRGFNNWRHSPVAREGLGIVSFMLAVGVFGLASMPQTLSELGITSPGQTLSSFASTTMSGSAIVALLASAVALYYMVRCYRIKARPFWNHWQVASSFVGSASALGGVCLAAGGLLFSVLGLDGLSVLLVAAIMIAFGLTLESIGLIFHHRDMSSAEHEGAASHYIQRTRFGKSYLLRNCLLGLGVMFAGASVFLQDYPVWFGTSLTLACVSSLVAAIIGRALFYVLVIPTTMPGAFFWKNKGFEEHARDIGLADMPQVGVAPNGH